jgi:polo-like kinase 1
MMELMKSKGRLSNEEAQFLTLQLLEGVEFMHSQKVIHRDLKLGNLFLTGNMEIKIGDFGLAAQLDFDGQRKKTLCGTPNYIAPEILTNQGHSTEVDIWSIGVIIYTLLVGTPPFETSNVKTTYQKIKDVEYQFPSQISVAEDAKDLIRKILTFEPTSRPSIAEMKQHPWLRDATVLKCPESLYKYSEKCGNIMRPPLAPVHNKKKELEDKKRKFSTAMEISPEKKRRRTDLIPQSFIPLATKVEERKENLMAFINEKKKNTSVIVIEETPTIDPIHKPTPALPQVEPLALVESKMEIEMKEFQFENIYVSRWFDFSNKYGFAYQFNNGVTGAYFNDCTKIIWDKKNDLVEYIEKEEIQKFKMSDSPMEMKKKISLIKYFEQYLTHNEQASKSVLQNALLVPITSGEGLVYLKKWASTKHAIIMRFSDKSVQVCFNDQTQILLTPDMKTIIYTKCDGTSKDYSITDIVDHPEVSKRMRYTKEILSKMVTIKK